MNLAETYLGRQVLEHVVGMVMKNPKENLPRLTDWVTDNAPLESHREIAGKIKAFLDDEESNWHKLAMRLLTETHPTVRRRTAVNSSLTPACWGSRSSGRRRSGWV